MNYFNLGEVFSFLEDLISLGQDIGSYGLVNTHVTWVLGRPASSGISISTMQHRSVGIPLRPLSVPLSLGFPSHFACGSCSLRHPYFHHSFLPAPPYFILVWILWALDKSHGWDEEQPVALVLNKTQKLDVGTSLVEKRQFIFIYQYTWPLKLLSNTEHR